MEKSGWNKFACKRRRPSTATSSRRGSDLLGNLLCDLDRLAGDNDRLAGVADCLTQLMQKDPAELERAGIKPNDPETLRRWLVQAEGLLLAHLADGGGMINEQ